jgi:hypothetical protein
MDYVAAFFLASLGATFIYAGYRLFCDLPALHERPNTNRLAVVLMNVIPGLLLALVGTALVTTQARAMLLPRPAVRHNTPPTEGTSWHPVGHVTVHRSA